MTKTPRSERRAQKKIHMNIDLMKGTKSYLKRKSLADANHQENHLKTILQYAAVPLTLVTALLYLFGYVHYTTYLSYWGLPENLFPISKDQSVISSLFRSMLYSATMLPKILLVVIILLAIMITTIVSTYRPLIERFSNSFSRFQRKTILAIRRNIVITTAHDKLMDTITLIAYGLGLSVFVLVSVVFLCIWFANQAKKDASKEHAEILSGKENSKLFSSRVTLYAKTESKTFNIYSGHLIQTSANYAALYNKNKGMMIFPLANVAKIEMPEKVLRNRGDASP